jgi:hypothetical protein
VTEALMAAIGTPFTIAKPAFPDNQRTVFKGYLFVGDVLLSESGMRNPPTSSARPCGCWRQERDLLARRSHRAFGDMPRRPQLVRLTRRR